MTALFLILQSFFEYQTRMQGDRLREAGIRAAEKGRRMAIAGVLFAMAGGLLFSGLLIALIDLGLQIDRQNGISFSGLMISASLLAVMGLITALIGALAGRDPDIVEPRIPPPPPRSELKETLEQIAVAFLKEFAQNRNRSNTNNPS